MTLYNNLCTDNRCRGEGGCVHRGPRGEMCWYYTERKLCEILDIAWYPQLDLDHLLSQVKDKLALLPSEEDYNGQVKLQTRSVHPATLTVPEEDRDPA